MNKILVSFVCFAFLVVLSVFSSIASADIIPSDRKIKVMAYNIEESGINPDWKQVVKEENPDIVAFVETGTWDDNNDRLLNQYCAEFNAYFTNEDPYNCVTTQGISYSTSGEAIMSRFPIVSTTQLAQVTLDDSSSFDPSHDFLDVEVNITGLNIHIIASHLKCCSGATNENKRERAQEGIINYMDGLGDVPVMYVGDLNSFSPQDTGSLAPLGDLEYGPMSMMLLNDSFGSYSQYGSVVHTFTDAFRTLNPNDPGYTYGHQNPQYNSRIDFLTLNQHLGDKMVSSTVGDTATADTGSDHYSVDVILDFSTGDTTPPETYNITLLQGWNLISLPLAPENTSIDAVLASIEGNYTAVYAWIGGSWKWSTALFNPLTEMDLEHGYWINMTAPGTLELSGTVPASTTINISTGWNLVGYPSITTQNITSVLSSIGGNYTAVYAWIDGSWKWSTALFNPLTEMSPGYGYWINATEDGSYEVGD